MGGAAAGVKFYCRLPDEPVDGVLHWMARHARQLGIMVRQVEDEIGVMNMVIGAAHAGCRAMCATSGGGFALMTEALGAAAMMEMPVVCINVQRAGPATGVPTKTEQGDLWQVLGAGQGDYPRLIVAPTTSSTASRRCPSCSTWPTGSSAPASSCPTCCISEGRASVDPDDLNFNVPIDRGEVIGLNGHNGTRAAGWLPALRADRRAASRRAPFPGTPAMSHVVATDEHDADGGLISDEFTNPTKRRKMHEKRMRKMDGVLQHIAPPEAVRAGRR